MRVITGTARGRKLAALEGVDTVEGAMALKGKTVHIDRADVTLPEGRHFLADLIGLRVVDADDSSTEYGILKEVSPTGANDVYHIVREGKTVLIPAICSYTSTIMRLATVHISSTAKAVADRERAKRKAIIIKK